MHPCATLLSERPKLPPAASEAKESLSLFLSLWCPLWTRHRCPAAHHDRQTGSKSLHEPETWVPMLADSGASQWLHEPRDLHAGSWRPLCADELPDLANSVQVILHGMHGCRPPTLCHCCTVQAAHLLKAQPQFESRPRLSVHAAEWVHECCEDRDLSFNVLLSAPPELCLSWVAGCPANQRRIPAVDPLQRRDLWRSAVQHGDPVHCRLPGCQ